MEAQQDDVLPATLMLMEAALEKGRKADSLWFAAAAVDMLLRPAAPRVAKDTAAEDGRLF